MKALVTGGSGFVGLYIVEQLVQRGDQVRAFCRRSLPVFEKLDVEHHEGDLRDQQAIQRAVEGVDIVYHVGGLPGLWGRWQDFHDVNVLGTKYVIEACQQHQIPQLIYTSSPSVIFDGTSHEGVDETCPYPARYLCDYAKSKAEGEQLVLQANQIDGLSTAAIRPHLVWGPRDQNLIPRIISRANTGKLRQVGNGNNLVSVAYVENVAAAHLQLADALNPKAPVAGQAYFINDAEPVQLWSWINSFWR
ncbi:MAG: NAD-dependent epimerase/dehydratase family protein [Planctomycetaceae bacterium]